MDENAFQNMYTICKLVEIAARKWMHKLSTFIVHTKLYNGFARLFDCKRVETHTHRERVGKRMCVVCRMENEIERIACHLNI